MKSVSFLDQFGIAPVSKAVSRKPDFYFKDRGIEVIDIEFGRYTEDCHLLAANYVDTGIALTDEELENLYDEPDFDECWCSYLWATYPERGILAMDQ